MALKPWYNVVTPREDLIEDKPLDASIFAVHLDHVSTGKAPPDYTKPDRFFQRTYLTQNLLDLAAQSIRRLSGIITETSPIFNLATQFGGGKTHALTVLYHLASSGPKAKAYHGVDKILTKAQITEVPKAMIGIFVGTEFSSVSGRGGDGEPLRKTPWGEIAFQIGGVKGFEIVKQHDEKFIAPAGDDLERLFDSKQPYLLLFDELLNYVSKHRNYHDLSAQFYSFLQTLSEFVRSRKNIVLAVSIPASELEMNEDDIADYERFKKLLDRLGKAMFMSAETETTEIIRRKLFEWVGMPADGKKTISEYVNWLQEHKTQIPSWFNVDTARDAFEASYPFHPGVISLFERKWQSLPRFQQTRGILRLLALWVSKSYSEGYRKILKDPLINLGTAPLEDPNFRAAVFEQLGENRLEVAVTTDIAGKSDAHSVRLDSEAIDAVKKARLNKKCATVVFFESNGGQTKEGFATIPEIKLSVSEPELDIGLVDNVMQSLLDSCYYLTAIGSKYKFSTQENLIKRFSDRKAGIQPLAISDLIDTEIRKVFEKTNGVEKILFPDKNNQVPDRPVITLVVIHPSRGIGDSETSSFVNDILRNNGQSARTYKSGLFFAVCESEVPLREEARRFLAWEAIYEESEELKLESDQVRQIKLNMERARKDLSEHIWKSYNVLLFLDKNNQLQEKSLGLVHSSQAKGLVQFYLDRLGHDGEISSDISPNYLVRNWPPAFKEWSTKNVRDVFYASAQFPRLLNPDSIKSTIASGVSSGFLAYVGKKASKYDPFIFNKTMSPSDIEISDDIYIITADEAKKHIEPRQLKSLTIIPPGVTIESGQAYSFSARGLDQHGDDFPVDIVTWETTGGSISPQGVLAIKEPLGVYKVTARTANVSATASVKVMAPGQKESSSEALPAGDQQKRISWSGEIPPNKWTVFFTKILAKFSGNPNLKIRIQFEIEDEKAVTAQKIEEVKTGLKELGLNDMGS